LKKLRKYFLIATVLAVVIYLILAVYGNLDDLEKSFSSFRLWLLPFVLFLAILNYITRFFRWQFYLNQLGLKIKWGQSFTIFFIGLLMSITPGKSGELLKSYLLKENSGIPISQSAPIVFAERFTDFLAVLLLSGVSFLIYSFSKPQISYYGLYIIGVSVFLTLVVIGFIFTGERFWRKISLFERFGTYIRSLLATAQSLLVPKNTVIALFLGIVAWFWECWGLYYTLKGFDIQLPLATSVFVYSFSTLVGALTFLPGGLGGTEASMVGLMVSYGIGRGKAVATTVVIRACTLWFAVLVGILGFLAYKVQPKICIEQPLEKHT